MFSNELRKKFLHYFKKKGHTIVPSSPVVPLDDPTLLFINAGMNQFKDTFLGNTKRDYTRAVSSQKCIRAGGKHNDLDNVGHTSRHLTFFEMLGNFSFGDYFKEDAIDFAWEASVHVFDLDPDFIWASVYEDDDEAYELWKKHLPTSRIVRLGEEENFWSMGDVGPCGPCSELLYDRGKTYSSANSPVTDTTGERYFEFWNLVFMELEKDASGKMTPLPKKSIDTGAGLERLCSLKMHVNNIFLTDILRSLIAEVENLSRKKYDPQNLTLAPAFHVIADHVRALAFSIADGAEPSNIQRGYVLRKILRRACRYGKMLGLNTPFLSKLLPRLIKEMGEDYPELSQAQNRISELLITEEESYSRTIQRGGQLLSSVIEKAEKKNRNISGEDAFKLKDTYGFPLEEILLIAKDENLQVDLPKFEELEKEAKIRSKKARNVAAQEFSDQFFEKFAKTPSRFCGYDDLKKEATILAIIVEGALTDQIDEGVSGIILLDQTPFYAEMGGQVGDTGILSHESSSFAVEDTISPYSGIISHIGMMQTGTLKKGQKISAQVHESQRRQTEKNHSATHLLHWALQNILGHHIKQAGSLVNSDRLRFDFHHHKPITDTELLQIECLVNEKIWENNPIQTYELSFEEAKKNPAIKQFFGEKYGTRVRVVDIEESKELCGGTHTTRTGNIGLFKILKEGSISKGTRRIEAITAIQALRHIHQEEHLLKSLQDTLKAPVNQLLEKTHALKEEKEALNKTLKDFHKKALQQKRLSFLEQAKQNPLIVSEIDIDPKELAGFASDLIKEMKTGAVVLGTTIDTRCQIVIYLSQDSKHDAKALIDAIAPLIQGGGGGKKLFAQAGGKNASELKNALKKLRSLLSE